MVRVIALVAPFIALACAKPHAQRAVRVHKRRDSPPTGYANSGSAPATDTLNLRLALTQNNFQGLEDALYAVSTPGNSRYGQHLSKEEVMCTLYICRARTFILLLRSRSSSRPHQRRSRLLMSGSRQMALHPPRCLPRATGLPSIRQSGKPTSSSMPISRHLRN